MKLTIANFTYHDGGYALRALYEGDRLLMSGRDTLHDISNRIDEYLAWIKSEGVAAEVVEIDLPREIERAPDTLGGLKDNYHWTETI